MIEYKVRVYKNGIEWRNLDGQRHRENGPAIERADGYNAWYKDGKLHREDGPAIICSDGYKAWYKDGKLHREDGPAIESNKFKFWFLNNKELTEYEFNKRMSPEVELTFEEIAEKFNIPVDKLRVKK